MTKSRSESQRKADERYEEKRKAAALPRYGGRCTFERKEQIKRIQELSNSRDEKEAIFKALDFFEQSYK